MKNFIRGLVSGLVLAAVGVVLILLFWEPKPGAMPAEVLSSGLESLQGKLEALQLRAEDIREDLDQTGSVVRRRARELAASTADEVSDARISATLKAKLARDPGLSAWAVAVSTTDGNVTLSGRVDTAEQVGRAMLLALETQGVGTVMSTLTVGSESP